MPHCAAKEQLKTGDKAALKAASHFPNSWANMVNKRIHKIRLAGGSFLGLVDSTPTLAQHAHCTLRAAGNSLPAYTFTSSSTKDDSWLRN